MYVKAVTISHIRSFTELTWEIPDEQAAGWHVILGDNGAGKSTFLRSIALALVGPDNAIALRQEWSRWLREDATKGDVKLSLLYKEDANGGMGDETLPHEDLSSFGHSNPEFQAFAERGLQRASDEANEFPSVRILFKRENGKTIPGAMYGRGRYNPFEYVWGNAKGWFSAGYGPFRRFAGGDREDEESFRSNPKLARHLTLFGENIALTETLNWLQGLRFKELEGDPEGSLLISVKEFINQDDFLPNNVRLQDVNSRDVLFVDGNGSRVAVEDLSDGYRSILSLTFDLIRQLAIAFGYQNIFSEDYTTVQAPGVVLIDEVDAHLHPSWQRRIGVWFTRHFPNLQFIVTTHSPLVCQAATTVYKLPASGSDETGGMITGDDLNRLLYGNVLEAYSTEAFGHISRSDESKKMLRRLAELNRKELHGKLSKAEREEQTRLRAAMPTTAHTLE